MEHPDKNSQNIEAKIKKRAYFIWKNTGSEDEKKNYYEAEKIEKKNVKTSKKYLDDKTLQFIHCN